MIPHCSKAGFSIHLQASTYMYALNYTDIPNPQFCHGALVHMILYTQKLFWWYCSVLKMCSNSLILLPLRDGVHFPSVASGLDYNYFDQGSTVEVMLYQFLH